MSREYKSLETMLVHAGDPEPRIEGAVVVPVFQSAIYEVSVDVEKSELKYIRLSNTPSHTAVQKKLSALENGENALVTSSGMAAISTALLSILSTGDHLLIQDRLYGGTHGFVTNEFAGYGLSFDFINGSDPDSWKAKLKSNTKAIYMESISNPLLQVSDLRAAVTFAKENGLVSLIDNTFASPVNFRPPEIGFDLSLHSCTKYLNGHSDIVAGAAIGRKKLIRKMWSKTRTLGGALDPHACFLLHRGMKTLALRVRYQNQNALDISRFLEDHPAVERVLYPGLESHTDFGRARELFEGCGGVLSFEVRGGIEKAKNVMEKVKLAIRAPSLGGIETLITRPVTTSHRGMSLEEREKMGIKDSLIRISLGIEAAQDIIEDLDQALRS